MTKNTGLRSGKCESGAGAYEWGPQPLATGASSGTQSTALSKSLASLSHYNPQVSVSLKNSGEYLTTIISTYQSGPNGSGFYEQNSLEW